MTHDRIRPATPADSRALGIVAPAAYAEAYSYLWADVAAYAGHLETFSEAAFAALLARDDVRIFVAERDGALVGFLSMFAGSLDPVMARPGGFEVARIYLLAAARRGGLGRRLLAAAIAEAARLGGDYVWLDVMETADWAQRAYARWGFEAIGRQTFHKPVREGMAEMIVMARPLDPPLR